MRRCGMPTSTDGSLAAAGHAPAGQHTSQNSPGVGRVEPIAHPRRTHAPTSRRSAPEHAVSVAGTSAGQAELPVTEPQVPEAQLTNTRAIMFKRKRHHDASAGEHQDADKRRRPGIASAPVNHCHDDQAGSSREQQRQAGAEEAAQHVPKQSASSAPGRFQRRRARAASKAGAHPHSSGSFSEPCACAVKHP